MASKWAIVKWPRDELSPYRVSTHRWRVVAWFALLRAVLTDTSMAGWYVLEVFSDENHPTQEADNGTER